MTMLTPSLATITGTQVVRSSWSAVVIRVLEGYDIPGRVTAEKPVWWGGVVELTVPEVMVAVELPTPKVWVLPVPMLLGVTIRDCGIGPRRWASG